MIKKINCVKNVGKFVDIACNNEFEKNNIIFGFNGAGKSTLSDIFYSLSNENKENLIMNRKTLPSYEDEAEKDIHIDIITDSVNCKFIKDKWTSKVDKMFVFNNQYVNDYVFVSRDFDGSVIPIGMSSEGVALMNKKECLQKQEKQFLNDINSLIKVMKSQFLDIKEVGGSSITIKGARKRCQPIAELKLFTPSQENDIKRKIDSGSQFYKEKNIVNNFRNRYYNEKITTFKVNISELDKLLNRVPRIYSNELSTYMTRYI